MFSIFWISRIIIPLFDLWTLLPEMTGSLNPDIFQIRVKSLSNFYLFSRRVRSSLTPCSIVPSLRHCKAPCPDTYSAPGIPECAQRCKRIVRAFPQSLLLEKINGTTNAERKAKENIRSYVGLARTVSS